LRPELPARSTAAQGEEIAARKGGMSTKMRPARGLTRWAGAGAKVAYIVEVSKLTTNKLFFYITSET
jgi:hypothetical protein